MPILALMLILAPISVAMILAKIYPYHPNTIGGWGPLFFTFSTINAWGGIPGRSNSWNFLYLENATIDTNTIGSSYYGSDSCIDNICSATVRNTLGKMGYLVPKPALR
jgi:hypothetical protein